MLAFSSIAVSGFRNLAEQEIELHPRFNVFAGENGQGKTNTIEALYLATTSRSFRTSTLVDCVAHGATSTVVRAQVLDDRDHGAPARTQELSIRQGRRSVTINGKRPPTLAAFALATPIVLFEPSSLALSQGAAGERRKLLDRVGVHLAARDGGGDQLLRDLERYRTAHLQRRRALERRIDVRVVEPFERLMAEHGAQIVRARRRAAESLVPRAIAAFERIAQSTLQLEVEYRPRAPEDVEDFVRLLAERRDDDARRRTSTTGPHLDDLGLRLNGHAARRVASQGQHRAIVLALKGAELSAIGEARDVQPILLLDDVSSELDPLRNAALFRFLHAHAGQVLLTTTRAELIEIDADCARFEVVAGGVRRRETGGIYLD